MRPFTPLTLATLLTGLSVAAAPVPLAGQRYRPPVEATPVSRLAAPTGLMVSWSNGSAVLAWQPVSGASGYMVTHATAPTGPWTILTRMPITTTTFAHPTTAAPGTLLYYQVMAANPNLISTNVVEGAPALIGFVRPVPQPPRGVGFRQVGDQAVVTWYPVPGASGYRIRVPDPKSGGEVRVGARTRTATFPLPYSGSQMFVSVAAEFGLEIGGATKTPALMIGDPALCWPATRQVGAGPSFVKATAYQTEVRLDFEPVSGTAAYLIERVLAANQTNASAWEPLACLPTGYTSSSIRAFGDLTYSLQPGQRYLYRVTAFTANGRAGWQLSAPVDIPVMPHPGSVTVTPTGGAVDVSWPATFAATNYLLETSYGYWELVPGPAPGAPSPSPMVKRLWGVPPGTHTFQVASLYPGNTPAPGPATRSAPLTVP